jgi:hypothetical protein
MKMIVRVQNAKPLNSTTIPSSPMVVIVTFCPEAMKMMKKGIIIYSIQYLTSPYIKNPLATICASDFILDHLTFCCNLQKNLPQCRCNPLPYSHSDQQYCILSGLKQDICEQHSTDCKICKVVNDQDPGY